MQHYRLLIFDWEGTLMMSNRQLYPETKEILLQLKKDYLLAVATNRTRRSLNMLLKETNLEQMFATTRCADETDLKPNPLMLQEILEELEMTATQALMIGDSEADMQMAKNIGMDGVPMLYDGNRQQLSKYQPKFYLANIKELISKLSLLYLP